MVLCIVVSHVRPADRARHGRQETRPFQRAQLCRQGDVVQPTMSLLAKYLDELGSAASMPVRDAEAVRALPVFFGQTYEVHRARLFDRDYVLLLCQSEDRPTPAQVEKHMKLARSALGQDLAFIFRTLPTFDRKRLIQRRIPFIVPGRQTYLPPAMIDLRENPKGGQRVPHQSREKLSAPAQVVLLYHLQSKQDCEQWPLSQWADVLGYSRSTLTRVYKELSATSLCKTVAHGRHITLAFPGPRRELWETALPHLVNPVRTRLRVRIQNEGLQIFEAGVTALAGLTMIAADREKVYAMSSAAFEVAHEDRKLARAEYPEEGTVRIERWKYAPGLLSQDNQMVDRLSLYLSLKDDHDERIQAALTELLEQLPW